MGRKKGPLGDLKQAFDEMQNREVLYRTRPRVVPHQWDTKSTTTKTWPDFPCIAVQANNEALDAHARIFIAAEYYGPRPRPEPNKNWPDNDFIYKSTDLCEFSNSPAAKIVLEDANNWAHEGLSKTWRISQHRAENALAVAKSFTRIQCYWSQTPGGGMTREEHKAMKDYHNMEEVWTKDGRCYIGVMTRTRFKSVHVRTHNGLVVFANDQIDWERSGRNPYPREMSYKYGLLKGFKEQINPKCWLFGQKREYMTCASYAQVILKAAGVEAPYSLGLQSAWNMINYDRKLSHIIARIHALDIPGKIRHQSKSS